MQKYKLLLLSLVLVLISCKNEYVLDDIENVSELRNAILKSEKYMKKIEVLPTYPNEYAEFGDLELGRIGLIYSTLNYDPNDSIQEGRYNPNCRYCTKYTGIETRRMARTKTKSENFREIRNLS